METNIISWNILNHITQNLKILLRYQNLDKKQIKTIVTREKERYDQIVQYQILKVIKIFSDNSILFLQEVDQNILNHLKKNYNMVYHTDKPDLNLIDHTFKVEYRVIILPKQFNNFNVTIKEIMLENDYSKKSCLMLILSNLKENVVLVNVHFHWKSTVMDLGKYAEKIYGEIKKSFVDISKIKIIICGDFNKSIKKVENYFIKNINKNSESLIIIRNNYDININDFTSHSTDNTENKDNDIIDHIITSQNIDTRKIEIMNTVEGINIFMDTKELININLENNKETNYLSDHKIIQLKAAI